MNQFAWEPTSSRFICLLGEGSRANATIFGLQKGGGVRQFGSIDTMSNFVSWSPLGRYAVLGLLKKLVEFNLRLEFDMSDLFIIELFFSSKQASNTGTLEFIDSERETINILHKTEHYAVYGLEWDPSGRYLASYNRCIFTKVSFNLFRIPFLRHFATSSEIRNFVRHLKNFKAAWEYRRDHMDHHSSRESAQIKFAEVLFALEVHIS